MSISYISQEYAIYTTYVINTLLIPSFIINAISNSLLPEISNHYSKKNYKLDFKKNLEDLYGKHLLHF